MCVCVLFPVAKYWLCFIAADGQNSECWLCWKGWVSVRATSGLSWARWTWLLHQAASLELVGALGAFCHSGHCSSAPHQIPYLPPCQEWRTYNVSCRLVLHIIMLSLHSAWVTYSHFGVISLGKNYEGVAVLKYCKWSQFTDDIFLSFLTGECGLYNPSFNWR